MKRKKEDFLKYWRLSELELAGVLLVLAAVALVSLYAPYVSLKQVIQDSRNIATINKALEWNDFKNEIYGFHFLYPEGMKVVDVSSRGFVGYEVRNNRGTGLRLFIVKAKGFANIGDCISRLGRTEEVEVVKSENIRINGLEVVKRKEYIGENKIPALSLYFLNDDNAYQISVWKNIYGVVLPANGIVGGEVDHISMNFFRSFISSLEFEG